MKSNEAKYDNEALLNLIAEFQALAIAFKRTGERMAESKASGEEGALLLLKFFQERQIAIVTYQVYLDSIRELEKRGKPGEKQIKYVENLCGKKLLARYGMTF